jgi:diketogulonate reductase-like aldo/keto reductase
MREHELNTGAKMPAIGFGTWKLEGSEAREAVNAGYRLIDTAKIYGNEREVGQAIKHSQVSREGIFVTTKLWPSDFSDAKRAFEDSLTKLAVEYVDLYLLHWPNGPERRQAWKELEKIHKSGRAKAVGVSNFMVEHLEDLFKSSSLMPAVNQIEFHPFIYEKQKPVLALCAEKGIVVEAYSPLAQARNLEDTTIATIASAHGKSSAQVMLRWAIHHGTIPIPRSSNSERIRSNLEVFDFELTANDMAALDNLS